MLSKSLKKISAETSSSKVLKLTSHVRKQTKLTKSNYFVKQNALKLIQEHVEEIKVI